MFSPDGVVQRRQSGETTILVRYLNRQSAVRLAFVPARPDFIWSNPPEYNLVDPQLFRQLLGREVIRHSSCSFPGHEKARRRRALERARPDPRLSFRRASLGPSLKRIHHGKNIPR